MRGLTFRGTARARESDPDISSLLGMNVSVSGTDRDTIGLLISNVVRGGPADQAAVDGAQNAARMPNDRVRPGTTVTLSGSPRW